LRQLGEDVVLVAEISPGKPDDEILIWGYEEDRIVITEDRDFSLVFLKQKPTKGMIFLRVGDEERQQKVEQIKELVAKHLEELPKAMTTLTVKRIKIRPLPKQP
jgi:predicted nuclease of predicted toxin-antitoxin system